MNQTDSLETVELTPLQREQMARLIKQLETTRVVAENFVSYFAKELGVNLSLYQFDAGGLAFVPTRLPQAPPGMAENLVDGAAPAVGDPIGYPLGANGAAQEM
jgi:hypothetical protein